MRSELRLFVLFVLVAQGVLCAAQNRSQLRISPKILAAKTIYLDDQTGAAAVGDKAREQLRKWGRFQIVQDPRNADMILLLSNDPHDGYIMTGSGRPATVGQGRVTEAPISIWKRPATTHYAFLTAIDTKTEDTLWVDSRPWGGLFTGFDSAGWRLIDKFRKRIEK